MRKSKKRKNKLIKKITSDFYIKIFFVFIFILTLINISVFLFPKKTKVLGIETANTEGVFWYNFLEKNPTYIPGWLEIGRPDKAKKIDPNYF